MDLSGINLNTANLSRADLRGTNLKGASLIRADLGDARLNGANLSGADVSEANLSGADLSETDFSGATLRGAVLKGALLRETNFTEADLTDTKKGNNTPHSQSSGPAPSRGAPAITPRIKGVPAFTAGDVGLYYQNHSFSAGPTVSGAPPTIVSVRFITSQEAQVLMGGESVGLPGNALVCYVELRGPFYPKLVSVPPGQELPTTVDTGIEVFDAQTGNILLWSVA